MARGPQHFGRGAEFARFKNFEGLGLQGLEHPVQQIASGAPCRAREKHSEQDTARRRKVVL